MGNISWIDGGTRFVSMDFNTYNPSTSLHTVARLAWEMPTGGVVPNDEIKTWKFQRYANTDGKILFVFHILFVLFVIGMSLMECTSCYRMGCLKCGKKNKSYWNSKWKAIDAINFIFFYLTIILFVRNEIKFGIDMFSTSKFVSFRHLQYGFTMISYTNAVNGGLLWIKLFKYLAVNKRLSFLFKMLGRSSTDILMFGIVLMVFVIAFGTAGFLTFNSDVDDFRSPLFSMSNMVRFTLVDMDYDSLTLSSRLWGSMFYFCWSLLMLLILANVFIAILSEAYSQVAAELTDEDNIDLPNIFLKIKSRMSNMMLRNAQHNEFDGDGDGYVDADELAKQCDISIQEARKLIDKYDTDGDGQLDVEEFEELKRQLIADREKENENGFLDQAAHAQATTVSSE